MSLPNTSGEKIPHMGRRPNQIVYGIAASVCIILLLIGIFWHASSYATGHGQAANFNRLVYLVLAAACYLFSGLLAVLFGMIYSDKSVRFRTRVVAYISGTLLFAAWGIPVIKWWITHG